jgi:DNA-binding MarR family transcriptional regulator
MTTHFDLSVSRSLLHPSERPLATLPALRALENLVQDLGSIGDRASLNRLVLMLAIARNPGRTANELKVLTGLSQASISRTLHCLGATMDLVESDTDADDTRCSRHYLTASGVDAMLRVAGKL